MVSTYVLTMKPKVTTCLKCGERGTPEIWIPRKQYPNVKYLRVSHGKGKMCHIGRIRTTEEAMGEFNQPQSVEEYRKVIHEIVRYGNSLLDKKYGHGGPQIRRELKAILDKYGLWS